MVDLFIEVDSAQRCKAGQAVSGDVFFSRRLDGGRRAVAVLADGLGSGIEASTLATLTASMALEYVASRIPVRRAAEIVMDALPIDHDRQISYSMFIIIDTSIDGRTRVIAHGSPPFVLLREDRAVAVPGNELRLPRWGDRGLTYWEFATQAGDRIVLVSDGVTQSGLGEARLPLGWGQEAVEGYVLEQVGGEPDLSARVLSRRLVDRALRNDGMAAGDDITCGVVYLRRPRRLLVLSGPPFDRARDAEFARRLESFAGRRVICGGSTANIVARELGRELCMDLCAFDPEVPTISRMPGIDLVTEGIVTLSKAAEWLETPPPAGRSNGATQLVDLLLESDTIEFLVGTRVNEAHQDPTLPVELDIRRNVIKKIAGLLETKHLKETRLAFF